MVDKLLMKSYLVVSRVLSNLRYFWSSTTGSNLGVELPLKNILLFHIQTPYIGKLNVLLRGQGNQVQVMFGRLFSLQF